MTITSRTTELALVFSAPVAGLAPSDVALAGPGAAVAIVGAPAQSGGNTWRVPASGLTDGRVHVVLASNPDSIEDLAGNDLSPTSWGFTVDVTAPTATLTSDTLVRDRSYTLVYAVSDVVDGEHTVTEGMTLLEGENILERTVRDLAGNSRSVAFRVTADTQPPIIIGVSGPERTDAREATFTWTAVDATTDVTGYRWRLGGPDYMTSGWATQTEAEVTLADELRAEGAYVLEVRAGDRAGNWSASALYTFIIDRAPFLISPDRTDVEIYEAKIRLNGEDVSETWWLGRGTHYLVADAADKWARLSVTREGQLPEVKEPRAVPLATEMVVVPDAEFTRADLDQMLRWLVGQDAMPELGSDEFRHVDRDQDDRLTVSDLVLTIQQVDASEPTSNGWVIRPDGTTTYFQDSVTVWSRDRSGTVTFYSQDGRVEAVRNSDGSVSAYGYRLDEAGDVEAILVSSSDSSTLFDANGQPLQEFHADGRRIAYVTQEAFPVGLDLTDHNGVSQAAGIVGSAAQFSNARGTYLSAPVSPELSMGDVDFTISGWFYADSLPGPQYMILHKGGPTGVETEFGLWLVNYDDGTHGLQFVLGDGNGHTAVVNYRAVSIQPQQWYFFVMSHDAANDVASLQVDNAHTETISYPYGSHDSSSPLRVGVVGGGPTLDYHFDGRIDEVGIWKRVLSAQEIADLYHAGNGGEASRDQSVSHGDRSDHQGSRSGRAGTRAWSRL